MTATARPWQKYDGHDHLLGELMIIGPLPVNPSHAPKQIVIFADCDDEEQQANAALIVKAVNSHDALLAALRDLTARASAYQVLDSQVAKARAALKLIEE